MPTETPPESPSETCPFCAEPIQPDAFKCPHCREWLRSLSPELQKKKLGQIFGTKEEWETGKAQLKEQWEESSKGCLALLCVLIAAYVLFAVFLEILL